MVKIEVRVKPGSKKELVEKLDQNRFVVKVKSLPKEGQANEAVIRAISDSFKIPKSKIKIIKGRKSRNKLIEV